MNIFTNFFKRLTETGREPGPKNMLFHLYNNSRRLRGTCAFERIGEIAGNNGEKYFIYAVATTKVDKFDMPKALRSYGYEETGYRLDCVLDYYEGHREEIESVLKDGKVLWVDAMCCVIPVKEMIKSTDARLVLSSAMKNSNTISSAVPHFLKKSKTRRELPVEVY